MHEMSLAEGILQLIEEATRAEDVGRVSVVFLEVGRLASVEIESLRFCFDAVVRDSIAEGARLDISEVPGTGWCMDCSQSVPPHSWYQASVAFSTNCCSEAKGNDFISADTHVSDPQQLNSSFAATSFSSVLNSCNVKTLNFKLFNLISPALPVRSSSE